MDGALTVRVYNDRFHAIWEQPVYFSVAAHALFRFLSFWSVCKATRTFGHGLKVSCDFCPSRVTWGSYHILSCEQIILRSSDVRCVAPPETGP